jgi:hypothetical protein
LGKKVWLTEDLARGFSSEYMDAQNTVFTTVSRLKEYMELYDKEREKWIAPYTAFVTSSMMGKTRHMKEVANRLPCVYICLRSEVKGCGYPHRSPSIGDWSMNGANAIINKTVKEHDFYFSTYRWSAFIICTIRELAEWITDGRFFTSLGIDKPLGINKRRVNDGKVRGVNKPKINRFDFAWLWRFFAEPPKSVELQTSWEAVQKATHAMLLRYADGKSVRAYFEIEHSTAVQEVLEQLLQCFADHGMDRDRTLPLIFIFDEARTLCYHDAYSGVKIKEEDAVNLHWPEAPSKYLDENTGLPLCTFSNFRALRRALRFFRRAWAKLLESLPFSQTRLPELQIFSPRHGTTRP